MMSIRSIAAILVSAAVISGLSLTARPGIRAPVARVLTRVQAAAENAALTLEGAMSTIGVRHFGQWEAEATADAGAGTSAATAPLLAAETDSDLSIAINPPAGLVVSLDGATTGRRGQSSAGSNASAGMQATTSSGVEAPARADGGGITVKGFNQMFAKLAHEAFGWEINGEAQTSESR